jgi:hypothetical protein
MGSDDQKRISQSLLCEIVGSSASTHNSWINKGRLERRPSKHYEEEDAVNFAVLRALMEGLGPTDGPLAWDQLDELQDRVDEPDLVALFDRQDKKGSLVSAMTELRGKHSYGHPLAVVDLADPIERVRVAFQRLPT